MLSLVSLAQLIGERGIQFDVLVDTVSCALTALGASVLARRAGGERAIPLAAFVPAAFRTALESGEIVTAVIAEIVASATWRAFSSSGTEMTRMPPYMPNSALAMPMSHSGTVRRRSAGTGRPSPASRLTATPNGPRSLSDTEHR